MEHNEDPTGKSEKRTILDLGWGRWLHIAAVVPYMGVFLVIAIITLLQFCTGCASRQYGGDLYEPAQPAEITDFIAGLTPAAQGLTSWQELAPGLAASRKYVSTKNPEEVAVADGDMAVTWGELAQTLDKLRDLLPRLDAEPNLLATEFRWWRLSGKARFSGYYEAEIPASRVRRPGYNHPLYRVPHDLKTLRLGDFNTALVGMRLVYRVDSGGELVPYYSREDIDTDGALRNRGLELAWLKDPVDAFFLQVQGSGRLRYEDGSVEHILYAADNGLPYTSVGNELAGMGLVDPTTISMQSLRAWFADHPDQRDRVLNRNKRYVFFRLGEDGPFGAMGKKLQPMVSLAVDRTTFPLGSVILFATPFPAKNAMGGMTHTDTLHGVGLAQDTGGDVKLRSVDIFCGSGDKAALEAGHLNARGSAWLLVPAHP